MTAMIDTRDESGSGGLAESFLAERRGEWDRFCRFTVYGVVGVVGLLVLMRIFLI